MLRSSAETIKQEIFRYRTRAASYVDPQSTQLSREATLASHIESISRQLMQTDVSLSALRLYTGPIPPHMGGTPGSDDGLSFLTPERYVTLRLVDQRTYYQSKAIRLERQWRWLQWVTYIVGGVGTLLAAMGLDLWIALTTAAVTACTTYLGYQQIETTLMKYNQAATDLTNVQGWWMALSLEERADQHNIDTLVEHTETILSSEFTGWVQAMHKALAVLRAKPAEKAADTGAAPPPLSTAPTANVQDVHRSHVQPVTAQLQEGIVTKNEASPPR